MSDYFGRRGDLSGIDEIIAWRVRHLREKMEMSASFQSKPTKDRGNWKDDIYDDDAYHNDPFYSHLPSNRWYKNEDD